MLNGKSNREVSFKSMLPNTVPAIERMIVKIMYIYYQLSCKKG